jgi:general secretion pathway protein E
MANEENVASDPTGAVGQTSDADANRAQLERYAQATNTKLLVKMQDLDPHDRPMLAMYAWSQKQGTIIVLRSGIILTSTPHSRELQNARTKLRELGIIPGYVYAADETLIGILLASSAGISEALHEEEQTDSFSEQQKHLRDLIREAITTDISDIHIEVRAKKTKVRMRQHGSLMLFAEWSAKMGREIAAVAFNKETDHATAHFNPHIPQDASMPLRVDGKNVRMRLASVPAHGGFDMVMRILAVGDDSKVTLEDLGYTKNQIEIIRHAISLPHGAILVAGPTGSGKTTTLAACMAYVSPHNKIYSIEDPVEKVVEKATQVPVNTDKDDRGFASMGKASLRMDPDDIVLGEMRDEDTAGVMVRAAITGHLVFSTIHTNSAPGIATRLADMGITPILLSDASVLRCLCCQRLAPTVCTHCCIPIKNSEKHKEHIDRWREVIGDGVESANVRGPGCDKCFKTAIGGRTVLAEVIWVDEVGREFIQKMDILGWVKHLKDNGWNDMDAQAYRLVTEGRLDPFDAEGVVGRIDKATQAKSYTYTD